MQRNRPPENTDVFDEQVHGDESESATPETLLHAGGDQELARKALEELPAQFREVLVLRELEGLSYKEIADICRHPSGDGDVQPGACPQASSGIAGDSPSQGALT